MLFKGQLFMEYIGVLMSFQDDRLSNGVGLAVVSSSSLFSLLTTGWMHEEGIELVMTNQNISSRNGFYHPKLSPMD